jgi:chemotaxis receptor (MCP) glutamine deamidase CheD
MLPGRAPRRSENGAKYAVCGIEKLLIHMIESGSDAANIDVCLVGAGNVLQKQDDTICEKCMGWR